MSDEPPSWSEDTQLIVSVESRQEVELDLAHWARLLDASLHHEGVPAEAEVGLTFIDIDEMTELNREHMGGSGPTDVLAFPIDGLGIDAMLTETASDAGPPIVVGDVVICPDVASKAAVGGRTLEDEIALLVVHAALHLIGHDHAVPAERERMQARERALLSMFYTHDASSR